MYNIHFVYTLKIFLKVIQLLKIEKLSSYCWMWSNIKKSFESSKHQKDIELVSLR